MLFDTSLRLTSPVAVTTTCSSETGASRMVKSSVAVPPAATVTGLVAAANPMRCTRTVRGPGGTLLRRYSPSSFVCAPIWVPTTLTCAAPRGRLIPSTITRPRIEPSCCASSGRPTVVAPRIATTVANANAVREIGRARRRMGKLLQGVHGRHRCAASRERRKRGHFATQLAILIKRHSTDRAGTPPGWAILSTCIVRRQHVLKGPLMNRAAAVAGSDHAMMHRRVRLSPTVAPNATPERRAVGVERFWIAGWMSIAGEAGPVASIGNGERCRDGQERRPSPRDGLLALPGRGRHHQTPSSSSAKDSGNCGSAPALWQGSL